jgi:hypothetical protein
VVQVIQDVRAEISNLQDHMVIVNYGSFVGDKFSSLMFNVCLAQVNNQIGEGKAVFDYMLGRGFFMLKIDGHNTLFLNLNVDSIYVKPGNMCIPRLGCKV